MSGSHKMGTSILSAQINNLVYRGDLLQRKWVSWCVRCNKYPTLFEEKLCKACHSRDGDETLLREVRERKDRKAPRRTKLSGGGRELLIYFVVTSHRVEAPGSVLGWKFEPQWPTLLTIMSDTSLSKRTVQKAIRELESAGLVFNLPSFREGRQRGNLYVMDMGRIVPDATLMELENVARIRNRKGAKSAPLEVDRSATSVDIESAEAEAKRNLRGAKSAPLESEGCENCAGGGAESAPRGVQISHPYVNTSHVHSEDVNTPGPEDGAPAPADAGPLPTGSGPEKEGIWYTFVSRIGISTNHVTRLLHEYGEAEILEARAATEAAIEKGTEFEKGPKEYFIGVLQRRKHVNTIRDAEDRHAREKRDRERDQRDMDDRARGIVDDLGDSMTTNDD